MNQSGWMKVAGGAGLLAGSLTLGCSLPGPLGKSGGRSVSLDEFVAASPGAMNGHVETTDVAIAEGTDETAMNPPDEAITIADANDSPEDWPVEPSDLEPGQEILVQSLVGQVHGRPIYADEFFEVIDDQVRILLSEVEPSQRESFVEIQVSQWFRTMVKNELFLAEARASLTPEQEVGLFHLLRSIREQEISKAGGTRSAANEILENTEGEGLEDFIGTQMDQQLANYWFSRTVGRRIIVSWRDIERAYEANHDRFNHPARLVLAQIMLNKERDAGAIQDVTARFDAGESFQAVAESMGKWRDGRWLEFEIEEDGINGIDLKDELKAALQGLEVGDHTGAVDIGTSIWWLHITAMEAATSQSIYDPAVQSFLRRQIFDHRHQVELKRYFDQLLEEAMTQELMEIEKRLIMMGKDRYLR